MEVCTYCGSNRLIEYDHVIAESKGGKRTVPACQACNRSKNDKQLMFWLREVKMNNKYRWTRMVNHNKNKRNDIASKIRQIDRESR